MFLPTFLPYFFQTVTGNEHFFFLGPSIYIYMHSQGHVTVAILVEIGAMGHFREKILFSLM